MLSNQIINAGYLFLQICGNPVIVLHHLGECQRLQYTSAGLYCSEVSRCRSLCCKCRKQVKLLSLETVLLFSQTEKVYFKQ